jgi:hypothetical protein
MHFMRRRCALVGVTMARPACARYTVPTTTQPSSSIRTDTESRRITVQAKPEVSDNHSDPPHLAPIELRTPIDDDRRVAVRKATGDGKADATGCAGHDRCLAGKIDFHMSLWFHSAANKTWQSFRANPRSAPIWLWICRPSARRRPRRFSAHSSRIIISRSARCQPRTRDEAA